MLRLFFRIGRRIGLFIDGWKRAWFVLRLRSLYPGRCFIDKSIYFGYHFSVIFDATSSTVRIGRNFHVRDNCVIRSGGDGKITIGNNVFFNNNCSINGLGEIVIGDNNQFGENVRFYDANHKFRDASKLISEQGYSLGKISIGNNCWIGANVVILKDVSIGDNVVVGANCLIHRSIPSNSLVINKQELEITSILQA